MPTILSKSIVLRLALASAALAIGAACGPSIGVHGVARDGQVVTDEARFDLSCDVTSGSAGDGNGGGDPTFPFTIYNTLLSFVPGYHRTSCFIYNSAVRICHL